ncbi:MAG: hypothetical protein NTW87_19450 [Planctomycetota bacterium]|nr:hypothetical protein [Planctomycetota bacterium]
MFFVLAFFFLVLCLWLLNRLKRPAVLAGAFAVCVLLGHWYLGEVSNVPAPPDLLLRAGIRFVATWAYLALLAHSNSVWAWVALLVLAPLLCCF